jgi:hypothetical protein
VLVTVIVLLTAVSSSQLMNSTSNCGDATTRASVSRDIASMMNGTSLLRTRAAVNP